MSCTKDTYQDSFSYSRKLSSEIPSQPVRHLFNIIYKWMDKKTICLLLLCYYQKLLSRNWSSEIYLVYLTRKFTPVMQVQPFTNPQSTTAEILQKILDSKVTRFTCYLGFCPWNYAILKKFRLLAEFRFPFYKNSEFHNFAHVNVKHVTQIWALPYVF